MTSPIRWLPSLLALLVSMTTAVRAADPVAPPAKDKFHLYLLIGQSNMAGRGTVEEADKTPHPRVLTFTKQNTWAPALDPLHFDKPIAGVGLGSAFGRAMAEANPGVTIGLIPCAVGGTPLSRWEKDGDLWKQAVARAKAAMKDGTLQGILWHQGESDSGKAETAQNYGARLARMVVDLRTELAAPQAPFVAGKLGLFLAEKNKEGVPSHWKTVNEQIAALPKQCPRVAVVESTDLKHKGDSVHFDSASLRIFGKRYAEALQKLTKE